MSAERYEAPDPHGRFRYGSWRGGPDPLAPPYDVRAAVDKIGSDLLSAGNLRDSLRELLQRGLDGRGGLDKLAERIQRLRQQARRRGDLGGTLDQVRAALDQALAAEREQLAGTDGDDARFAELELDTLPDDVAGAVRALEPYSWRSEEARATYQQILQMLQREVLDSQFAGLKQALESPDPEAMQRVKDMLADLNALLAAHARNEDTTDQFRDFMASHGEFFPEQPETVEELIDALARRQAAAQRMLASLSPEQREQLGQLMSQALGDADLASQMAQLGDNLRALRPGLDRESPSGMRPGGESLGYSEAVQAVAELADLEALQAQLSQAEAGSTLDDVDVDLLEARLGAEAVRDFAALRDLERELEQQGYLERGDDGLRLTPRAVRRLGQTALRRVFAQLTAAGHGDHDDRRTGAADEPTGLTRPWVFGDELPIDAPRTVANALRRTGLGSRVALDVEDFEVTETERRTSAAVALCVDLSFSMVQDGRWGPMKQTALALNHLIETRFRQDALQVIGFNRLARRLSPVQLASAEPEWIQGTNLQHALLLAARHLRRHPDAEPVVLVVTDGEPTAHLTGDGQAQFRWPTTPETVRATIAQVDELGRYGATINTFMLGDDPGLARFVDAMARRAGGRVFTPDIGRLGSTWSLTIYRLAVGGAEPAAGPVDLAILGGGLAGGLVALALTQRRPDLRLAVIEEGALGGNHVWSSFARDVDPGDEWLVAPLISHRWPDYDVAFPAHRRTIAAPYRSITSERFAAVLTERVPASAFVTGRVAAAEPGRVRLTDGREVAARAVLDARGPGDAATLDLGWQKFVGQTLHTREPHGVVRPVVMDATVPQTDGYRFIYLLPFGPHEIFVEDTYYSDTPDLDRDLLQQRIAAYAAQRGWRSTGESRLEHGVLPVVLGGDFAAYWDSTGTDLAKAGMRAGLFHPTTGYSLPDAVRLAALIAAAPDLSHPALVELTSAYAHRTWADRGFYRALDTMLFRAAEPDRRYVVLERFYRLKPDLVQRFYAAQSTLADQVRILSGRPPVPIGRAIRALAPGTRTLGAVR